MEANGIEIENTPLRMCDELFGTLNVIKQWIEVDDDSIKRLADGLHIEEIIARAS